MAKNERYPAYLAKVLSNPVLNRVPKTDRDMAQFTKELAKAVLSQVPMAIAGNKASQQDVNPLSAQETSPGAQITIAAHNLYTIEGNVSYNAGSLTGLAKATQYFVYADDPNFSGGAVTYYATTTPLTLTTRAGAYDSSLKADKAAGRYYVGTITTPADGASPATTTGTPGGGGSGDSEWTPPPLGWDEP